MNLVVVLICESYSSLSRFKILILRKQTFSVIVGFPMLVKCLAPILDFVLTQELILTSDFL